MKMTSGLIATPVRKVQDIYRTGERLETTLRATIKKCFAPNECGGEQWEKLLLGFTGWPIIAMPSHPANVSHNQQLVE